VYADSIENVLVICKSKNKC